MTRASAATSCSRARRRVHDPRARRRRGDLRPGVRRSGVADPWPGGVLPHGRRTHVLDVLELHGPGRQLPAWRAGQGGLPCGVRDRAGHDLGADGHCGPVLRR
eukprot:scaffold78088_cov50-Phaeocystis_antarctica.AAC.2